MAMFDKKDKKAEKAAPKKTGVKETPPKQKQSAQPKPYVPPDVYTLLLGLAALFFIAATVILGLNYYWYQSTDPAVVPMSWAR